MQQPQPQPQPQPQQQQTTSSQILKLIKNNPYTQFLNGKEVTFSIMKKKQQTFIMSNERFLCLIGIESIGYARTFPANIQLPFKDTSQLPKFKQQFTISQIKTSSCNQQTLTIEFSDPKIGKWEFSCPSKVCALNWKNKIEAAIHDFTEYNAGHFKNWEDYLKVKQAKSLQQQISNTNEVNNYLNTHNYQEESIFLDKDQRKSPQKKSQVSNGFNFNANIEPPQINSNFNLSGMGINANLQPPNVNASLNFGTPQTKPNTGGQTPGTNFNANIQLPSLNSNLNFQSPQIQANINGPQINSKIQPPNLNANFNFQPPQIQANISGPQINSNIGGQLPQGNANVNLSGPNINTSFQAPSLNANVNLPQVNANVNFNANGSLQGQGGLNVNANVPSSGIFSSNINTNQSNVQPQKSNGPTTVSFKGPEATKVQSFILQDTNRNLNSSFLLNKSMSSLSSANREQIKNEISRQRRNWIQQLLGGQQEGELVIEFRNYVQKIVQVIIGELHISQQSRIFPAYEYTKQYASYLLEDTYLQIYFYSEDQYQQKHLRYQNAAVQFKNMEYLLNSTQNGGPLRVPFMMLYQYKGFLGMARSRIAEAGRNKNRELLNILNRQQFQEVSRISAEVLLNENKCKIVSYDRKTPISKINTQHQRVYFVQKLTEFLPTESTNYNVDQHNILRLQLMQDEEFDGIVFRDRKNQIKFQQVLRFIDQKIKFFVKAIENQEQYFTNTHELSEIIHFYGLNIRHLGLIYRLTTQPWIKKIIRSEIAARCVKNFFRVDIQRFTMQKPKVSSNRQIQAQRKRVISFLNVLFGNTESTLKFWKNINSYSQKFFNTNVWDKDFSDLNIPYFLQAVQSNLKIVLSDRIFQRRLFSSPNTFQEGDFIQFQFSATIYNLDFTDSLSLINEYIAEQSLDSFQNLCQILIKQTSTKIPYLELLKKHPIHQRINEFLVNFTSPDENLQLYNKIQTSFLPSKFLYESKLAQIKWYLKANRFDRVQHPARFIEEHARRWLGQIHPLFTQLNRILAEYFCEVQANFSNALKYANASLAMQQALFGGDNERLWRDYFLIGKIHYFNGKPEDGLKFLIRAKGLAKVQNLTDYQVYGELCLMLAKGYINTKFYKEAYLIVKDLYQSIKEQRDQKSLFFIAQSVTMIKQLLQINQEHDSFYKFIETDFSNIISAFVNDPKLLVSSIKMIAIPYLKNVILQKGKSKVKLLSIIEEISKIQQSPSSSLDYLKVKIAEGTFPKNYLNCLRDIDSVIDEIVGNQMLDRWKSFNRIASSSLLDKIGNSQINRGFEFLAIMTAIFNLLGREVLEELFIIEK